MLFLGWKMEIVEDGLGCDGFGRVLVGFYSEKK